MRKRVLRLWGLLLVCGLVACQSAAPPTLAPSSTPVPTSTSEPPATPVPTATPVQIGPTATPVSETSKDEKDKPTETATTETAADAPAEPPWQIPAVSEKDWGKGKAGAGLVIVEYSDFQ